MVVKLQNSRAVAAEEEEEEEAAITRATTGRARVGITGNMMVEEEGFARTLNML